MGIENVAEMFPYSTWYKRNGLRTLEASLGINFITILVFWAYILPNTGQDYYKSSLDEAFGIESSYLTLIVQSYFMVRNIVVHTLPFIMSMVSVFMADVVFLESDWWIIFDTAALYLFTNYAVTYYSGTNLVYYFDWGTSD
jgi:hypothetical protein